ncbi:MAG: type II toxin-antitoxin system VapC family toxin [candidate division KSB1 bacterium]
MNIFLDTNAVAKLYHREAGTDNLMSLIKLHKRDLVITLSDITRIELHSAFFKQVRMKQLKPEIAAQVLSAFERDLGMFNVVEIEEEVKDFAAILLRRVASKKSLRTLDAIQLSTALVSEQILPVDYFVTSDKKLIKVAKDYLPIFDPEQSTRGV